MSITGRYRWGVIAIFFAFMLLHQIDKQLINPLLPQVMEEFQISKTQMGAVMTGSLLVGTLLYPLWGFLYDRWSRARLLALASFIWGSTTWLSALARRYVPFFVARASTGIDDSSYPGLYSLVADYFGPQMRSRIYGLLQLAQPLGYLSGMILALMVAPMLGGWRSVFYLTGSLGLLVALVIFLFVREVPRGQAEPELEQLEIGQYRFSLNALRDVLRKRTMWLLFLQGFFGVFPWNVISVWFFTYLSQERGYDENAVLFTMAPLILMLSASYFVGGALGDFMFQRTPRGRVLVSSLGVIGGAFFLLLSLNTPLEQRGLFFVLMMLTAFFMPFSAPNVVSTVFDITLPEVRSTAQAVEYFIENTGAAFAPLLAGIIADRYDLGTAILWIGVGAWLICFLIYLGALFTIPEDIRSLRQQMALRSAQEKARQMS
ncbi:MAG: MFS transporter [Chloroflexi bacterium]|jgi:MFS family permease|nr:MFS transporter [Chloroflexota bacterium]